MLSWTVFAVILTIIPCHLSATILPSQASALVEIRKSLKPVDSIALSSWTKKYSNCSKWQGVRCNSRGQVTELLLSTVYLELPTKSLPGNLEPSDNYFTGGLSDSLGKLQNLELLILSLGSVTGPIPSALGALKSLRTLHLGGNLLYGNIPTSLGGLVQLEYLNLESNQNLNEDDKLISALNGSIPASFANLKKLKYLYLSRNYFSGPISPILKLPLVYLSLSENQFSGGIGSFSQSYSNLTYLDLGFNKLSGQLPKSIGLLTKVKYLSLASNRLSGPVPAEIGRLIKLEYLYLSRNKLKGSVAPIFNITSLVILSLENNSFTGKIDVSKLVNLNLINLASNRFTGGFPGFSNGHSSLLSVTLDYNPLSGSIPSSIRYLRNADSLSCISCGLTGSIPTQIGNLTYLTTLLLSDNNLFGSIPAQICRDIGIYNIGLNGNNLSGNIPSCIGNLDLLQILNVKSNYLKGNLSFKSCPFEDSNFQLNCFTVAKGSKCNVLPQRAIADCKNFY